VSCGRKKGDVTWLKGEGRDEDARYVGENEGEENAWRGCNCRQGGRGERGGVERELTPPPRHQIAPQPPLEGTGKVLLLRHPAKTDRSRRNAGKG
jgi:hypothetical protein